MPTEPRTHCPGGRALRALACALFLALAPRARAEGGIYEAAVPLTGTTEADRNRAFGAALESVAVIASGRAEAASNPVVADAAANPARYVQQYSTTPDHLLKVGFDADAVDGLLQRAGLPFWPQERPVTEVFLVVPAVAGGQRALLSSERSVERFEVQRSATARGLPIAWPDRAVPAAQVRAMLAGAPPGAEAGENSCALAGVEEGGSVSWRFTCDGVTARGTGTAADGPNLATDALVARYAPSSTRGTTTVEIRVGGIEGIRAYAALTDYLNSLSLVRAVEVRSLDQGVASFAVTLRGDAELLRRVVSLGQHLKPVASAEGGGQPADFEYVP
jgi:hypothetical protein